MNEENHSQYDNDDHGMAVRIIGAMLIFAGIVSLGMLVMGWFV